MKTLYVSDLDGTLLRSNGRTSDYTIQVINKLVSEGMLFSYATARSYHTARKVTSGLEAKIPLIVYNGVFIKDNITQDILISHFFDQNIKDVIKDMIHHDIHPIIYSMINDKEKFSFIPDKCSLEELDFIKTRKGDERLREVDNVDELYSGEIFYISIIDDKEKLEPLYYQYKDQYHCIFQKDIYSHDQWLEIMPKNVSKANAIIQLKEYLHCDHVVVFGDGINDIEMFKIADEAYALSNAVDELKDYARAVIGDNDSDAVAAFLLERNKSLENVSIDK